jgi:CBS domain-containing protein
MVVYAKDFMTKEVVTIDGTKTAMDAAKLMMEREVGSLLVVDAGKPVGLITDRDIVTRVLANDMNPAQVRVASFMSKPLITANLDTPMIELAKLMDEKNIRRVPIVEEGRVVGIVTSTDMGKASKILAPYLLPRIPEIYLTPKKREK